MAYKNTQNLILKTFILHQSDSHKLLDALQKISLGDRGYAGGTQGADSSALF